MTSQDIAIVGMSALFAGAKDLQTYWQNIIDKVNAVEEATDDWAKPYFDPNSTENNRIYTRKGGFIGELTEFNPVEFGVMPNSIAGSDPAHFLALKQAQAALEDANYIKRPFNREKTGIILGGVLPVNRGWSTVLQHGLVLDQTTHLIQELVPGIDDRLLESIRRELQESLPDFAAETVPGVTPNIIPARIANRLDLKGPNYLIDAACASSSIAIDLSVKELRSGRCDMMLAGGVNAAASPQINMGFCQLGALSPTDIRPFDRAANGTLLGEGLGILVLKRLEDAEADGDRIYAVIKGVGISSDGKALGLLAPRVEGERLALERAYAQSGVDPKTVSLIEAHGTGIPLGDRTEIESLSAVFGRGQETLPTCAIGSVKSAIGHCLLAAGAAGAIKTALALYHKVLPPTLCDRVNPDLNIEQSGFYINNQTRPWIHGNGKIPRRAGVNAFGFGGINAHIVLEEYRGSTERSTLQKHWPTELCLFAATGREALINKVKKVRGFLSSDRQTNLADLAYTLSRDITESSGAERLGIVAKDVPDLQNKLARFLEKIAANNCRKLRTRNGIYYAANSQLATREKTAFLFPGEGSQYQNMLADLCQYFPQVRSWFDFLDEIFGQQREILPSAVIFPPPTGLTKQQRDRGTKQLYQMDWGSEAVFTANMALHELLRELGIEAAVMVGHSTGENSALIASGTMRLKNRQELGEKIFNLNQIYQKLAADDSIPKGSLMAVGAVTTEAIAQLIEEFGGRLHLAMANCPNQAVVFGAASDIDAAVKQLEQMGGLCSRLPFDRAYHTPLFAGVSAAFKEYYDTLDVGPGQTRMYSCATGQEFPKQPEAIRVLAAAQWSSQVRFTETIETLYKQGMRTFVEVGPSSNLTGFVNDILRAEESLVLASNSKRRSGLEQLQHLIACMFTNGATVKVDTFYKGRELHQVNLDARTEREEKLPGIPNLDLTMPIARLQPEFVREIRAQIQSKLTSTVEVLTAAAETGSPLTSLTDEENTEVFTTNLGSPLTPLTEEENTEVFTTNLGSPLTDEENTEVFTTNLGSPLTPLTEGGDRPRPEMGDQNLISNGSKVIASPERDLLPRQEVVTPADSRLTVVQSHFDLMQEFLASQARVTAAVYQGGMFSPPTIPDLSQVEAWPLLGEVVEQDSQHLYCERCFDLESDIFLYDHTLGGQISERHPELMPLPVIPFTISMEIIAEAAVYLMGGDKYVVGIDDINAYQWLAIDRGQLCLGIYANVQSDSDSPDMQVKVQLFETQGQRVFEGTVKLADRFGPAPAPRHWQWSQPTPSRWSDEQWYDWMYHGQRFQGVKHIRCWDKEGIEADLQVMPRDDFFVNIHQPSFQLDAGLLDAAGQLVAYWISEQFGTYFTVFPFQVRAFRQYQVPLPPGSMVLCRCKIGFTDDRLLEVNFDLLDSTGSLIARLEGWKDIYYEVPPKCWQYNRNPQKFYLSEPWRPGETGVICRRLDPLPEGFLDYGLSLWQRVLAHLAMNERERELWYNLPENSPQRREWLLGTIAAKDAIRQWAKQTYNLELAPVDMEIISTDKLLVRCPELEHLGAIPDISISHSQGYVVAVVAPLAN